MSRKLVIFGGDEMGEVAHYFFSKDSDYEIAAFTLDSEYIKENTFQGLPVVPFETVQNSYSPEDYDLFVAVGYSKFNRIREQKYKEALDKKYRLATYVSSKANVFTDKIGQNSFIFEANTIQPFVRIGNNVILWSGNHVGHHSQIDDHCFLASHIVVSGGVHIKHNCFIGVNATFRDHITVGHHSIIGAGAFINGDVEDHSLYKTPPTPLTRIFEPEPVE